VNDSPSETYFNPTKRFSLILVGACVSIFVISVVITLVAGITFLRAEYSGYYTFFGIDAGRWLFSMTNAF
jgi:hypothetical protein